MESLEVRKQQYKDMVQHLWGYVLEGKTSEEVKSLFEEELNKFFEFGTSEGQIIFQKIRAGYDFEVDPPPPQPEAIITSTSGPGATVILHYDENGKVDNSKTEYKEGVEGYQDFDFEGFKNK
jgi:hypothetical protein